MIPMMYGQVRMLLSVRYDQTTLSVVRNSALGTAQLLHQSADFVMKAIPGLPHPCCRVDTNDDVTVNLHNLSVQPLELVVPRPKDLHTIVCRPSALQKPSFGQLVWHSSSGRDVPSGAVVAQSSSVRKGMNG